MSEATLPNQMIRTDQAEEQKRTTAKNLYIILTAFNLISYLWLLVTGTGIDNIPPVIWVTRLVSVPLALYLGRLWKDRGFRILFIFFLIFILRCFIPDPAKIFHHEAAESTLSALWLFTACYGMGRIFDTRQLKRFLLICASIWIAGITVLCCMSIYTAWTGQSIKLIGKAKIYVSIDSRLEMIYVATNTGSYVGISILITTIAASCIKNRIAKTCFFISLFPLVLALALSDSRTAFISTSAGLSVMAFSMAFHYAQTKKSKTANRFVTLKAWIIGIIVMLAFFCILLWAFMHITPLFNQIKTKGLISRAYAETIQTEGKAISNRGFEGNALNGRAELWEEIFRHFQKNPIVLLTGESVIEPMHSFQYYYSHCHSIYIQVLLESGIPGLMLLLSFILFIALRSFRAIRTPALPRWIRLLPAIPVALWVGDIDECFTWLRSSECPMVAILFISAGIIASQNISKKSKEEVSGILH